MTVPPKLSIIIVNFNQKELTLACLGSIIKNQPAFSYEVIVVDNGSSDGSIEAISKIFPEVMILSLSENAGFGRANNLGVQKCSGELLLFLNNDTRVVNNVLSEMVNFLETQPQAAAGGAALTDGSGQPDIATGSFPGFRTEFFASLGLDKLFKKNPFFSTYYLNFLSLKQPLEVDLISGADLIIRRAVFEKIGGFDENFFFYYEDIDLCLRLKKAGYKIFYLPKAKIIHQRGSTIGSISEQKFLEWRRSRLYFYKKNYPLVSFYLIKFLMLFTLFLRFLIFPVFLTLNFLKIKKNLENYGVYIKAWKLVINFGKNT